MKWSDVLTTLALANSSEATSPQPQVNLGYANYEGVAYDNGRVNAFLGMRYAAPPLHENRFRLPQDPKQENGTISAKEHGDLCFGVQDLAFPLLPIPQSEDCLFIDVYAPESADNLPVMIWIQGGGFVSLFNPNYNGTGLIEASEGKVIVVSFNYRVGPYGFLASKELQDEGNLNIGLHDQRKAIQWVQQNIADFGGDKDKVTLFGTSVGAGSVLLHTLAYGGSPSAGDELNWQAGIAPSPGVNPIYKVNDLQHQFSLLLEDTKCESLECLRSLDSDTIQAANVGHPPFEGQSEVPLFPWGPVVDGTLLPDTPAALLAAGKFAKDRPLIIASSATEGTIFVIQANTTEQVDTFMKTQFATLTDEDMARAHEIYADVPQTMPGVTTPVAPYYYRLASMYGDAGYTCQALDFATFLSEAGVPVHLARDYILDPVELAAGFIVPHTWELEAVWGPGYATNFAALPGADSYKEGGVNHEMVKIVQSYWLNFAKSLGDPNGGCTPRWGPFEGQRLRLETGDTVMEEIGQTERDRCAFWREVL